MSSTPVALPAQTRKHITPSTAPPNLLATSGLSFTSTVHSQARGRTLPSNNDYAGRDFVVCITGAGKGLGFHIALAYAQANVSAIVISSRTQSDLDTLKSEIKKTNPNIRVLAQTCDTQSDSSVKNLADTTRETFDRCDVCVSNAGIISKYLPGGSLPKGIVADLDFERVVDVNFLGTARVARHFTPLLVGSAGGAKTFVAITSLSAHMGDSAFTPVAYNLSKRAVCGLVEHMAADHASAGLVAHAVHPGAVVTPQTKGHSLGKGDAWEKLLTDDVGLCGGFLTWLTLEKRYWLSGRYISVNWDVGELLEKRDEIESEDLLKFRMAV